MDSPIMSKTPRKSSSKPVTTLQALGRMKRTRLTATTLKAMAKIPPTRRVLPNGLLCLIMVHLHFVRQAWWSALTLIDRAAFSCCSAGQ